MCIAVLALGLLIVGANANGALASSPWAGMRGYSACGGIDRNGNLQAPCGFKRATYVKQSIKSCPRGTFAAAGACYVCTTGYRRNILKKITDKRACRKPVSAKFTRATYLGSGKCPSGSHYDGRNGGECWRCPSGYGRTAAGVDKWNACGRIGKKAVSAIFVRRACPTEGSVHDPRNGGECWKCPEDANRTGNPVTGTRACKIAFAFAPAIEKSDLKCGPGEIFDFVNGGSCWTCPQGTKRTLSGIKTAKACRNNNMEWVVPKRQTFGIFGLGTGADDILAKLIADRTRIDSAVKKAAQVDNKDPKALLKSAWHVIDTQPQNSPYLSALLANIVMEAAVKPASQRTAAEKNLLARVSQLVQWDRQFVAYQAKQAHDTWVAASRKAYAEAEKKMGAAVVYSDSMVTPPDYNRIVVGAIQLGAGFAGPAGAVLVPLFVPPVRIATFPFRTAAREASKRAVQAAIEAGLELGEEGAEAGVWTAGSAATAAMGPAMIAIGAAVIVTMEIDKFAKEAAAEGKIRQSIAIANRPVNLGVLLQQKGGPDEFQFHWSAVMAASTRPSANFKRLLAAYKAGKNPDAAASGPTAPKGAVSAADVHVSTGSASTANTTTGTGSVKLSGGLPGSNPPKKAAPRPSLADLIEQAVTHQSGRPPKGAMRIEASNMRGSCLTKRSGTSQIMSAVDCRNDRAMWIAPDPRNGHLIFASKYCLVGSPPERLGRTPGYVAIEPCSNSSLRQKWQLTRQGLIELARAGQCITLRKTGLVLQKCGSDPRGQKWRPWKKR